MNYKKHYDLLIDKYGTWEKPKGVYTERHRKIPGSMGGKYVKGNAFYVPARVHFIVHFLLAKIYGGEQWNAVLIFKAATKHQTRSTNSKLYEIAKKNQAIENSKRTKGEKNPMYGRKRPDTAERNKGNTYGSVLKGVKRPDISERMKGGTSWNKGKKNTPEHIAAAALGLKKSNFAKKCIALNALIDSVFQQVPNGA